MYNVEVAIREFLLLEGVLPFWIDSAVNVIKQGLVTNAHFPTNMLTQRVTIKQGHVSTYTATVMLYYPDTQRAVAAQLRYTFNPKVKQSHKLWLTPKEGA